VIDADFVPPAEAIKATYDAGEVLPVVLHDGSRIVLRKVSRDYNMANRGAAIEYLRAHHRQGEIVTGLLYIDQDGAEMHSVNGTTQTPLNELPYEALCPGGDSLAKLQKRFR
jgi:2-oxoglutarate ferredoxin oxidoreductase subunit beta